MNIIRGSFDLMKQMNISVIMGLIRSKGPISRAEIANLSGLTPASVSKISKKLIKMGLIKEIGLGESTGGRPPVYLVFNPKAGYIISINISAGYIEIMISDLQAEMIEKKKRTIIGKTEDVVIQELYELLNLIIVENSIEIEKIFGIGMAVHGIVNPKNGISIYAPYYNWKNLKIREIIEQEFNIPVFIDNDVRCMALAEKWFGIAKHIDDFIILYIGDVVGAGIVNNGKLYYGKDYSAGEIGHITIDTNGPKCSCGNYGCLQSIASNSAMVNSAKLALRTGEKSIINDIIEENLIDVNMEVVIQAAEMEDRVAINILEECAKYLGIGIADLINILNPEMIVLAGKITEIPNIFREYMEDMISNKVVNYSKEKAQIEMSNLGEDAALIGGATLVLKQLFEGRVKEA